MSKLIASPRSLEAAVMHALGLDHNPKPEGDEHNVGDGCGSCGCGGRAPQFPALPGGMPAKMYDADLGTKTATEWYTQAMQAAGYPVTPYADIDADMACMTPVSSGAPVVVAVGATTLFTISPTRGWLDMYYLKLVGLNAATGLEVDPASYRITPPRVADCPQPCDATAMRGAFYRGPGDACCGCRWRALVGRTQDGEALTFSVTNDGIAPMSFQAVARGFCNARNLCLS